jgi:hypothetical protein
MVGLLLLAVMPDCGVEPRMKWPWVGLGATGERHSGVATAGRAKARAHGVNQR